MWSWTEIICSNWAKRANFGIAPELEPRPPTPPIYNPGCGPVHVDFHTSYLPPTGTCGVLFHENGLVRSSSKAFQAASDMISQ